MIQIFFFAVAIQNFTNLCCFELQFELSQARFLRSIKLFRACFIFKNMFVIVIDSKFIAKYYKAFVLTVYLFSYLSAIKSLKGTRLLVVSFQVKIFNL